MNKFMGVGYLVSDFEYRNVGDKIVANGAIAIKRRFAVEDKTDFINISIWGKPAEIAIKYTKKGDLIAIIGELQIEKKNEKVYSRVNVEEFKFFNKQARIDNETKKSEVEQPNESYDIDLTAIFKDDEETDLPF